MCDGACQYRSKTAPRPSSSSSARYPPGYPNFCSFPPAHVLQPPLVFCRGCGCEERVALRGMDGTGRRSPPRCHGRGAVPPPLRLGISQTKTHRTQVPDSRALPPAMPLVTPARLRPEPRLQTRRHRVCVPNRACPPSLLLSELPGGMTRDMGVPVPGVGWGRLAGFCPPQPPPGSSIHPRSTLRCSRAATAGGGVASPAAGLRERAERRQSPRRSAADVGRPPHRPTRRDLSIAETRDVFSIYFCTLYNVGVERFYLTAK